jgi:flagellar motor switch protein FliM
MSEVLSQSQIDALLNAVRTGEKDLDQVDDEQTEKKYRKYDFKSPRKFTKDRLKMLNGIFENYARVINSRLNAILHTNCEIGVESIEEQRYYEFSNALTDGDVLALAELEMANVEEESPMMIYLATPLALSMMDRMMGGEGEIDEDLVSDYTYTDLELRLYETLVKDMISVMGSSWENYLPLNFTYTRTEVNPTLVQIIGLEETVVIVDMRLKFSNVSGRMSICLPGTMLTNLFAAMNRENPGRRGVGEDNSEDIFHTLRDSSLEIVAQLGDVQLSLSDVYHLNVGDVINMERPKDSPVFLEIGGNGWFTGRMGTHKKNMAVKIDEVCYQADQRSE